MPDFFSPAVLEQHIVHTLSFYYPRCVDPGGGFYHYFRDDGTIYERRSRHLVSSTRFVFVFANAWRQFRDPAYLQNVRHGVDFLRRAHRNPQTGGYAWQLDWEDGAARVTDADNHCYGLAFVLLAYAHALNAGVGEARGWIIETFALMEQHFWEEEHGLYADQASADWSVLAPYRGQNANMHACEALLAAFRVTEHLPYLHRAETLARNITGRQAERAGGMIWEHYTRDWQPDWDFNLHDKANLFRPWGYQPGHFTEWSKLLLQLEAQGRHLAGGRDWLLPTAQDLYARALRHAWDNKHGGLHYGFAPSGSVRDADKYFWVQAETLAAAALLGARTGPSATGWTTSVCGATAGSISSTTRTAPGTASSRRTTASTPTRRAPPARSITTRWARAGTSSRPWLSAGRRSRNRRCRAPEPGTGAALPDSPCRPCGS